MNKGIIKISGILYQKEYNAISGIFKYFKPTHIEFRHWENDIWYFYGESELFETLIEGQDVPLYSVEAKTENEKITYKFIKE